MGTAGSRNGTQAIQANATRFPNGIKAVADYVHALGVSLIARQVLHMDCQHVHAIFQGAKALQLVCLEHSYPWHLIVACAKPQRNASASVLKTLFIAVAGLGGVRICLLHFHCLPDHWQLCPEALATYQPEILNLNVHRAEAGHLQRLWLQDVRQLHCQPGV